MSRHRQTGLGLRRAKAAPNILVHPPFALCHRMGGLGVP